MHCVRMHQRLYPNSESILKSSSSQPVRVLVPAPDWQHAAGGVRKLYRHVDVLNAHGIEAFIVHKQSGFRCTWFQNQTPVLYAPKPSPFDILLAPERIAWQLMLTTPGVPKVVFNQNVYQSFDDIPADALRLGPPYRHPDFLATIAVSQDNIDYLEYAFPGHPLFRLHYGIDPKLFYFEPRKKKQIAFMPRKKKEDARQVLQILGSRGALDGYEVVPISQKSETETARILRESQIFLSFSTYEGSPIPPLEALACGCVVVGYHGRGGREYVNDDYAFPVEAEDIRGFACTVENVIGQLRSDSQPILAKAKHASDFILSTYTPQQEERDILNAWEQILRLASRRKSSQTAIAS